MCNASVKKCLSTALVAQIRKTKAIHGWLLYSSLTAVGVSPALLDLVFFFSPVHLTNASMCSHLDGCGVLILEQFEMVSKMAVKRVYHQIIGLRFPQLPMMVITYRILGTNIA